MAERFHRKVSLFVVPLIWLLGSAAHAAPRSAADELLRLKRQMQTQRAASLPGQRLSTHQDNAQAVGSIVDLAAQVIRGNQPFGQLTELHQKWVQENPHSLGRLYLVTQLDHGSPEANNDPKEILVTPLEEGTVREATYKSLTEDRIQADYTGEVDWSHYIYVDGNAKLTVLDSDTLTEYGRPDPAYADELRQRNADERSYKERQAALADEEATARRKADAEADEIKKRREQEQRQHAEQERARAEVDKAEMSRTAGEKQHDGEDYDRWEKMTNNGNVAHCAPESPCADLMGGKGSYHGSVGVGGGCLRCVANVRQDARSSFLRVAGKPGATSFKVQHLAGGPSLKFSNSAFFERSPYGITLRTPLYASPATK